MKKINEKSCGIILIDDENQYLLVQLLAGHWDFPKGHVEQGETEKETALREVLEETGLNVHILDGFQYVDSHPVPGKPGEEPDRRMLTMTTCHSLRYGAFGNDHRWIVYAELEGWLPRSAGTPDVVAEMEAP